MNDAAASSFPAALRACMEAGCGKKPNADGFAVPWTQRTLAEEIEVSDRAIRQWLGGERTPDSKNFEQLLFILSPRIARANEQHTNSSRQTAHLPWSPGNRAARQP